jgi:phosphate transport system substrate-binding protein
MLALGMAVVGFTGLALSQATPALADPTVTLVAVGSDTIQDVYNQFGLDAAGNLLGSYDAVNPVTAAAHEIITPVDGTATVKCSFARPNGSGEGTADLRLALNPASPNGGSAPAPVAGQGCVDIARSSSGPGSLQSNTGPIVYIPFALDAVAGATGGSSCPGTTCAAYQYTYTNGTTQTVTATPVVSAITQADLFTENDLINLYKNCTAITEGGVTYDPHSPPAAGDTQIDLYVPQSGSGTRNFWASTLGFSNTSLPACVHDTIVGGPLGTATPAVPVEEHNGTPMATDPNGFGPFSIAQWISQRNGHNDRRHTAVLHNLAPCTGTVCTAAVSPFSNGNPATGSLNSSFPITRNVYSVVSFARVTTTSDPLFSLLNNANPAGAFMCTDSLQIISYGFAVLPATTCGEVIAANRAQG